MQSIATASGKRANSKDHGELSGIQINLADNGFVAECQYRPKSRDCKDGPSYYDWTPERHVFESRESLAAFIMEKLAGKGEKSEKSAE